MLTSIWFEAIKVNYQTLSFVLSMLNSVVDITQL